MAIQGRDTNQTQSCWCRTFTQQHFPEKEGRKAAQTHSPNRVFCTSLRNARRKREPEPRLKAYPQYAICSKHISVTMGLLGSVL
jgi:hypothetical protein